jgi:hypothetical protein
MHFEHTYVCVCVYIYIYIYMELSAAQNTGIIQKLMREIYSFVDISSLLNLLYPLIHVKVYIIIGIIIGFKLLGVHMVKVLKL